MQYGNITIGGKCYNSTLQDFIKYLEKITVVKIVTQVQFHSFIYSFSQTYLGFIMCYLGTK